MKNCDKCSAEATHQLYEGMNERHVCQSCAEELIHRNDVYGVKMLNG